MTLASLVLANLTVADVVWWIVIGLIAGFFASVVMRGGGYGIIGDIIVGIIGAFLGGWLLSLFGLSSSGSFIWTIIIALIGACILIAILRAVSGGFTHRTTTNNAPKQPHQQPFSDSEAQTPIQQPKRWSSQTLAPQETSDWSAQKLAQVPSAWREPNPGQQPQSSALGSSVSSISSKPSRNTARQRRTDKEPIQPRNTQAVGGERSTQSIFVSHSSKDNDFVTQLVQDLRQALGKESAVWYDTRGLLSGDSWFKRIEEEIVARDIFLLILSPDAMTSNWVRREYDIALSEQKRIIPVLYQSCKMWPYLKTLHYTSFLPPKTYESALSELFNALQLPPMTYT